MSPLADCLAVIPARGGSKGLPGKNIRPLCELPLLVHSLRCAHRVGLRAIVSTDSDETAQVVRAHGGDVPFMRPAELAQDDTPMLPVLRHALLEMERIDGRRYESLLLLDPTSPGRLPGDIAAAFARLDADPTADGVIACSRPSWNPFFVGVTEQDGVLAPAFPDPPTRRQDAPPFFRISGALYLWRRDFVLRAERATDGRQLLLEIPEERAFSIDTLEDFQRAERYLMRRFVFDGYGHVAGEVGG